MRFLVALVVLAFFGLAFLTIVACGEDYQVPVYPAVYPNGVPTGCLGMDGGLAPYDGLCNRAVDAGVDAGS